MQAESASRASADTERWALTSAIKVPRFSRRKRRAPRKIPDREPTHGRLSEQRVARTARPICRPTAGPAGDIMNGVRLLSCACGAEIDGAGVEVAWSARATGDPCEGCFKLSVTDLGTPMGDLSREADSAYSSWGTTTGLLECDDGSASDAVNLGTIDLESGVSIQDLTLPDVDLESGNLDCKVELFDGANEDTLGVTVELP